MKRKLISAVLVTVMAAGMITGCSGKNSSIRTQSLECTTFFPGL